MNRIQISLKSLIVGDIQADRVVPPSGFTARLTLFASGAMAFLAVFAMALSLAAGRLAERWGNELARTATIRIVAPQEQRALQTQTAMTILETTAGVAFARVLSDEDQKALLAPWFGNSIDLGSLPVPQLIEVIEAPDGFDAAGLRLRLAAEVPGAVLDDHTRWRAPLVQAANRLWWLGVMSMLLIACTTAAIVTLAAQAVLAANAQVISVLRLVGAKDSYIAQAFVRRFTLRALNGSLVGAIIAALMVFFLPSVGDDASFLTGLSLQGWHWFLPLLIPLLAASVAFVATRSAAQRTLKGLT